MNVEDLAGADWGKVDPYPLDLLEDVSSPPVIFPGTKADYVRLMVENGKFRMDEQVSVLLHINNTDIWPKDGVIGVSILSRKGRKWPALVTFEGIVTLAKDKNIRSIEGSRTIGDFED